MTACPRAPCSSCCRSLRALDSTIPLVVLGAHASIAGAVQAIKLGAEQFLPKPVEPHLLLAMVDRLLEAQRLQRQQRVRSLEALEGANPFLGESVIIRRLEERVRRVLDNDRSILILGETGTGKGVLASWLHLRGPRARGPLVELNCAGLTPQFLETELFGHERGAFTSAVQRKQGLLEVAHRGTFFLDEVGDMDPLVQPKLLKVLEEKRFRRLGEVEERTVDIRFIAATHQDLLVERVRTQHFRGDLYFRISTLPLRIPALRERPEDLPVLCRTLLERIGCELGRPGLGLTREAESALRAYPWPGNVRELRNVLERAVLLSSHSQLHVGDLDFSGPFDARLPLALTGSSSSPEPALTLREVDRTRACPPRRCTGCWRAR